MMNESKKIGVALSGGGYRAAAFHIGTLKKLNELNILEKVDVLSTISGGSITGATYCSHQGDFEEFEAKLVDALSTKSVISYVLRSRRFLTASIPAVLLLLSSIILPFTPWSSLSIIPLLGLIVILTKYQFKLLPISAIIEKAYDDLFFDKKTLSELCTKPELAIGATNLQTMRPFTFSKRKMEDSAYAYYAPPVLFNNKNFPIARAVAASSCVPFAFSPISIDKIYFLNENQSMTVQPALVDGGVYDNQGIHKLTQRNSSYSCDIVIVSDAGNSLPFNEAYNNTFTLLLRTVNVFMMRIKHFQMIQNIYQNHNGRQVAYQSLAWDLEACIPGFLESLKQGNISLDVMEAHGFLYNWIDAPKEHEREIICFLESKCQLKQISSRSLSKDRLNRIRRVGTNLRCLKQEVINDMIIHAENLTELQIRLYCPSLFREV